MHFLHRSSMIGGRALRRIGSSPRAPPPQTRRLLLSKSDSIKKRSGATAKGSKRARLRAGLAAALQELRLAGRGRKHGGGRGGAGAVAGVSAGGACRSGPGGAAAALPVATGADEGSASRAMAGDIRRRRAGRPLVPLLAVLALACVVALGRAPAVCCCTCAASWLCRGPSTTPAGEGRRRSGAVQSQVCDGSSSSSSRRGG